jgi:hypothetical protein
MRLFVGLTVCLATCSVALAQLPTATGRQINMSDAGWKIFIPNSYVQRPGNVADLLVHFHGDPQTYSNNAQYAHLNTVIVTVNYSGLSSAYETPFTDTTKFQTLMNEALTKVRAESDFADNLQWDKIGVSSFSAGYGAVRQILKQAAYRNDIDCLLAADSLYASFTSGSDHTPLDSQMTDYRTYATMAAAGSKTFIFSHSQVPTYTYCETRECADDLMAWVGTTPSAYTGTGLGTLDFYRHAKKGNFEVWGATGSDGDSHLEHLRYIGQFLQELPLASTVPEPAAGTLLVMTFPLLLRRRR